MTNNKYRIKENIRKSHSSSQASRYGEDGLTGEKTKLSSKNFDKLMAQRGLSAGQRASLKASMKKDRPIQVRHAKAGEIFITTHGKNNSSAIFVSEQSLGNTPYERIDKGALPHSNTAEYETKVKLTKDQNLIYGEIAPQSKFSKMDPKQVLRRGGAEQIITDGGYNSGAVINMDPKYPMPAKSAFLQQASKHKRGCNEKNKMDTEKTCMHSTNLKGKGNINGQS